MASRKVIIRTIGLPHDARTAVRRYLQPSGQDHQLRAAPAPKEDVRKVRKIAHRHHDASHRHSEEGRPFDAVMTVPNGNGSRLSVVFRNILAGFSGFVDVFDLGGPEPGARRGETVHAAAKKVYARIGRQWGSVKNA